MWYESRESVDRPAHADFNTKPHVTLSEHTQHLASIVEINSVSMVGINGVSMVEWYWNSVVEVSWRRFVLSEDKRELNKEENFRIVWLSNSCVAHLLCVASWVAAHMGDEKYCECRLQH